MNIIMIGLILSSMAFGMLDRTTGDWGSGGGNAIVCFYSEFATTSDGNRIKILNEIKKNGHIIPDYLLRHIKSIEMYDLYEAKKTRGISDVRFEIIAPKEDEQIYSYINRLSRRFAGSVPAMGQIIQKSRNILQDRNILFHDYAVRYQNDLGSVTLPSGNCVISTMAAQVNYNNSYQVHIDSRLYHHEAHSLHSKATLILHELLYTYGRAHFDHKDSGAVRELVGLYMSYDKEIMSRITEGVVSKSLVDLNFVKKTNDRDFDIHKSSMLFHKLSSFSKYYFKGLFELYKKEKDVIKAEMMPAIRKQLKADDLADSYLTNITYSALVDYIRDLTEHFEHNKWEKIRAELYEQVKVSKRHLINYTNESLKELENIKYHFINGVEQSLIERNIKKYSSLLSDNVEYFDISSFASFEIFFEENFLDDLDDRITNNFFRKNFCYTSSFGYETCSYGYVLGNSIPRELL